MQLTEFANFTDFIAAAKRDPLPQHMAKGKNAGNGPRSNHNGTEWHGTATFQEALDLAEKGWPEALERIKALAASVAGIAGAKMLTVVPTYDVSGDYPDIGRFCSGDPEHMVSLQWTEREGAGEIVRVVANSAISVSVRAETIFARGAAVLALIDLLEQSGRSCEVVVITTNKSKKGKEHAHSILIKTAGELPDLDRLAFALCNPSMQRRLMWGARESDPVNGCNQFDTHPSPAPAELQGDVYLPEASGNDRQWSSPALTAEWITAQLVAQGVEFED